MRTSKYTKEFKDSTIELIINNNESVPKIASDLLIKKQIIYP
jgi:transposase